MLAGQGVGLKGARRRLLRVEAGGGAVGVTAGTGALASGLRSVGEHRMGDGGVEVFVSLDRRENVSAVATGTAPGTAQDGRNSCDLSAVDLSEGRTRYTRNGHIQELKTVASNRREDRARAGSLVHD